MMALQNANVKNLDEMKVSIEWENWVFVEEKV